MERPLYERLGGYDAIVSVVDIFLPKMTSDSKLKRFWDHRGADGLAREKQLLIDFLCHASGGSMVYTGRNMKIAHQGMRIDNEDWGKLVNYLTESMDQLSVPSREKGEVLGFVETLKNEIVEV